MKFLSELGSCCGGPTSLKGTATNGTGPSIATMPANDDVGRRADGEKTHTGLPSSGSRKVKSTNSSGQWKPSLGVIWEDKMVCINNNNNKESSVKAKAEARANSNPKAEPPSSYNGEEYWNPSGIWALPVFAPALF